MRPKWPLNLNAAKSISGWMTEAELTWLATHAQNHEVIAEVGSWMGRTTRALADNTNGHVYAIDTWEGSPEHKEFLAQHHGNWLFEQFIDNMTGVMNKCDAWRQDSVSAAHSFFNKTGKQPDMVFLDASHEYVDISRDIMAWMPIVKDGGLLAGHDYRADGGSFPGVKQAVEELVPNFQKGPVDIWYTLIKR